MVLPQQVTADESLSRFVPSALAAAATRYQLARVARAEQLALMARQNLLDEWNADVRATVLSARERITRRSEARAALPRAGARVRRSRCASATNRCHRCCAIRDLCFSSRIDRRRVRRGRRVDSEARGARVGRGSRTLYENVCT